jgi:hypothetical protein
MFRLALNNLKMNMGATLAGSSVAIAAIRKFEPQGNFFRI